LQLICSNSSRSDVWSEYSIRKIAEYRDKIVEMAATVDSLLWIALQYRYLPVAEVLEASDDGFDRLYRFYGIEALSIGLSSRTATLLFHILHGGDEAEFFGSIGDWCLKRHAVPQLSDVDVFGFHESLFGHPRFDRRRDYSELGDRLRIMPSVYLGIILTIAIAVEGIRAGGAWDRRWLKLLGDLISPLPELVPYVERRVKAEKRGPLPTLAIDRRYEEFMLRWAAGQVDLVQPSRR
jgi:hypothetical protein